MLSCFRRSSLAAVVVVVVAVAVVVVVFVVFVAVVVVIVLVVASVVVSTLWQIEERKHAFLKETCAPSTTQKPWP